MVDVSWRVSLFILMKVNNFSDNEALTTFIEIVNMKGIDDALNDIRNMEKKYYLEKHPYEIYYSERDKRYRTYLPPQKDGGKRSPITAVTKENLENKIASYYKQMEENPSIDTFEKPRKV